ncbi:hypothetical protein AY599_05545 [Leptolyngbya valderiana BDU 20041]|nr:hypothetical protein AY599_05545 [Leptolyngbya valderiana BDU 20041]
MVVAIGCGLHCATLTVVFLSFPTLWLNRRYWEIGLWQKMLWLEWTLLAIAWLMMLTSLWFHGLGKGRRWSGLMGLVGLVSMTVLVLTPLHFASPWVGLAMLASGLMVGLAHFHRIKRI